MSEGELTIDDYRLVNCIATGNTSQIWEVIDNADQQHYAMKLLLPEAFMESEQIKVIKHEGNVSKLLDHPNFVKFQKLVANKEHAYLVMEYFRAPNVKSQILTDLVGLQVRLRKMIEQVAIALAYLHDKGWVHKDIKPENILFNKGSELRLIDFSLSVRNATGIGKLLAGKPKVVQGTRTYIAPETIKKEPTTPQTDIYSLGITIYEVLTGTPPFKGSSPNDLLKKHLTAKPTLPSDYNDNVTADMDRFVLKMLAKKPADRHKSMNELLAEFRNVKIFKEDVQELADQKFAKAEQERKDAAVALGVRLDSRTDHERTTDLAASGAAAPPAAASRPAAPTPPSVARPPASPPQQRPAAPMPPAAVAPPAQPRGPAPAGQPGMVPPRPGAPVPPPPGTPYPQQPWNYPPQPQARPGQPPQGMPPQGQPPRGPQPAPAPYGAPPSPAPAAGRPQYQVRPPAAVPPGSQQPAQPPVPQRPVPVGGQPAPAQPVTRPAPPPKPQTEPDDLPLMDELPPVI